MQEQDIKATKDVASTAYLRMVLEACVPVAKDVTEMVY